MRLVLSGSLALFALLSAACSAQQPALRFTCGSAKPGYTRLTANSTFADDIRAGFDFGVVPAISAGACTDTRPFLFSANVAPGNYRVTVVLGGPEASTTTVWAEARRLMLQAIRTPPNASVERSFDVNVRIPTIAKGGQAVQLTLLEKSSLDWDDKLTLEFNGDHPSFRSIALAPVHEPTLYIAGDTTAADQTVGPWAAWGQMLPRFLEPGIAVANYAASGDTIRRFVGQQRLAKIMSLIQPGDYLFIQFPEDGQISRPAPGRTAAPLAQYKQLLEQYIAQARARGAIPVLVTSRRSFDAAGQIANPLDSYTDAMRKVAAQQHTALIDLNAMSKTLMDAMGPQGAQKVFLHWPASSYPSPSQPADDGAHFSMYGAYELARCVVRGIREDHLPLEKFLDPAVAEFSPTHPDPAASVQLPATSLRIHPSLPPLDRPAASPGQAPPGR